MTTPLFISETRPRRTRKEVEAQLKKAGITSAVAIVGCRGYYRKTAEENTRGIYDDAIFIVTPETFAAFNANVDPSVFRRGIATLTKGVWQYKVGIHGLSKPKDRQYTALVQAGEVVVSRDGQGAEKGWFGINIHRGSNAGTSSLGCQTIVPAQWDAFISLVQSELKRHGQKVIPYLLTDESLAQGLSVACLASRALRFAKYFAQSFKLPTRKARISLFISRLI